MPVDLSPRPQPGDLITSDWMGRLVSAIEELQRTTTDLSRRLAVIEQSGGRKFPELVPVKPTKLKDWLSKLRDEDGVLDIADKESRLKLVADKYLEARGDFILDDEVMGTDEITAREWPQVIAAAGLETDEGMRLLSKSRPSSVEAIRSTLGGELDVIKGYADPSTGMIGRF